MASIESKNARIVVGVDAAQLDAGFHVVSFALSTIPPPERHEDHDHSGVGWAKQYVRNRYGGHSLHQWTDQRPLDFSPIRRFSVSAKEAAVTWENVRAYLLDQMFPEAKQEWEMHPDPIYEVHFVGDDGLEDSVVGAVEEYEGFFVVDGVQIEDYDVLRFTEVVDDLTD